jgi:predicted site-specific integrase-resolvase
VTGPLDSYTAADRAGITYRQLDWWCRQGYVHAPSGGSGYRRTIPGPEVDVLLLMARMSRARFATCEAARLARLSVTENLRTLPLTTGTGLVLLVGPP